LAGSCGQSFPITPPKPSRREKTQKYLKIQAIIESRSNRLELLQGGGNLGRFYLIGGNVILAKLIRIKP